MCDKIQYSKNVGEKIFRFSLTSCESLLDLTYAIIPHKLWRDFQAINFNYTIQGSRITDDVILTVIDFNYK